MKGAIVKTYIIDLQDGEGDIVVTVYPNGDVKMTDDLDFLPNGTYDLLDPETREKVGQLAANDSRVYVLPQDPPAPLWN